MRKAVSKEIEKIKRKLIREVKITGSVRENFGQNDVRKLRDKYFSHKYLRDGVYDEIDSFDLWAMEYSG